MFDAIQYLTDRRVPFTPPGGSKNVSAGWVGISCPFCGDSSDHGAFRLIDGRYSCWRCPGGSTERVIMALESCDWQSAHRIVSSYSRAVPTHLLNQFMEDRNKPRPSKVLLPPESGPMRLSHRNYLNSRGFDDKLLEAKYGLLGTGPTGSYALRIIAPILLNGVLVSYQGRDITGQALARYKACPKEKEVVSLKHTLYNIDSIKQGGRALIVEGITDVWCMGDSCVATFGTSYLPAQVMALASKEPSMVFLLLDPEPDAQAKADKFAYEIAAATKANVETIILDEGDPGSMAQDDADHLRRELGL